MLDYNITAGQVALLKGIFSIVVAITELPTGIIADRVSKKMSLAIGAFLFAIHSLVYVVFPNFIGFVSTQIILAFSSSFISGADDGYLDDYITECTHDDYLDIAGKIQYWGGYAKAVLFLSSGYLYYMNKNLNFLLTFGFGILAFIIVCMLPKTSEKHIAKESELNEIKNYLCSSIAVLKQTFMNKLVFGVTIISAIVTSLLIFNFECYQIFLSKFNFPSQYNGVLYASFMILGGVGAKLSKKMLDTLGVHKLFALFNILITVSYTTFALAYRWELILAAIVVQQVSFGSWGLILKKIIIENIPSQSAKSTMISMNSLLTSLIKGGIVAVLGFILESFDYVFAYEFMAAVMAVLLVAEAFYLIEKELENIEGGFAYQLMYSALHDIPVISWQRRIFCYTREKQRNTS